MSETTRAMTAHDRRRRRQEQVLKAARCCFERYGFRGASMASIAAAADMSVGHIYHYFDSKECIVTEIVCRDIDYCLSAFIPAGGPEHLAITMISAAEGRGAASADHVPLSPSLRAEAIAEAGRNPGLAGLIAEAEKKCREHLLALMSEAPQPSGNRAQNGAAAVELVLALWCGLLLRKQDSASAQPLVPVLQSVLASLHAAGASYQTVAAPGAGG